MKLEHFVKGLKVGKYLRLEIADENCRDIIIWRAPVTGEYYFASDDESYGDFETPEELLKCLKTNWLEYDYEVYKSREELKTENAKLEKALKMACACGFIEGKFICKWCPFDMNCNKNTSRGGKFAKY